jgi:hypothetical protein
MTNKGIGNLIVKEETSYKRVIKLPCKLTFCHFWRSDYMMITYIFYYCVYKLTK